MQRMAGAHEHLDGDLEPDALAGNLRDLARINERLGGTALTRRAIVALSARPPADDPTAPRDVGMPLTLLDVGTGAADIPAALLRANGGPANGGAANGGPPLVITATDPRAEIVAAARALHGGVPGLAIEVADGTALPYADGAFDIAHASLVLHHLEPPEAAVLLGEMARVARLGIIVNDLDRSRLSWLGAWVLLHLATRNRYTRHDGPLSVRRAYRPREVTTFASAHGLHEVRRFHGFARHRYAIAFGRSSEERT